MEKDGHRTLPTGRRNFLDTPITEEEQRAAVSTGTCNKAPGRDCICLGIFEINWDNTKHDTLAVFNQMCLDGQITEQQKHGMVVCITKTDIHTTPADYIHINLLNNYYKILAKL